MKIHIRPSQIVCSRILRSLQSAAAVTSVAALALTVAACGDDKKTDSKSDLKPADNTVPVVVDPNLPVITNPTTGTPTTAPTSTDIKVALDGNPVVTPDGMYAVLSPDAATVTIYPYDFCKWVATHDPSGVPYAGNGAGIIINVGPSGTKATEGTTYTVNPVLQPDTATYDKNIIATYRDYPAGTPANECDITTRGGVSGSATWTTVSSTTLAGSVDATILSYQPSTTSTVKGTFVASKCATTALSATPYASDADACHDAADQTARKTSNGLHYK